jgi:hypothetical protein
VLTVSEIALTKLVSIYVRILLYDRILHHQYYIYLSLISTASAHTIPAKRSRAPGMQSIGVDPFT